jgi:hypothetical protein
LKRKIRIENKKQALILIELAELPKTSVVVSSVTIVGLGVSVDVFSVTVIGSGVFLVVDGLYVVVGGPCGIIVLIHSM